MRLYKLLTNHNGLFILVGPTSSGKSELAVKVAKKFNGEIINADSRQIYRGLNLGTGKVTGKWFPLASHPERAKRVEGSLKRKDKIKQKVFIYKKIRHHLIDSVNPKIQYSAALFQHEAKKIIADVIKRGKLPILTGGTGHWIDAVAFDQVIPNIKPNPKLRLDLEKQSTDKLFKKLQELDPVRAKNIDPKNKRRLIRALEIILTTKRPIPPLSVIPSEVRDPLYNALWLGLKIPQTDLYKKIDTRLKHRLKQGMINEVYLLHSPPKIGGVGGGISWRRLESFGLEYRYIAYYLQKKLTYEQMLNQLSFAIKHYSQRQMTWWKKNKEIKWIKPNLKTASNLVSKFLIHNS